MRYAELTTPEAVLAAFEAERRVQYKHADESLWRDARQTEIVAQNIRSGTRYRALIEEPEASADPFGKAASDALNHPSGMGIVRVDCNGDGQVSAERVSPDDVSDREAEELTRRVLGDGKINPNAASVSDLFIGDDDEDALPIPEGFTPWPGGARPGDARGKYTRVFFRSGNVSSFVPVGEAWNWGHSGRESDIIAYRVEQPAEDKAGAKLCSMEVGCEDAGVCYAAAHGEPERCGKHGANDEAMRICRELAAVREGLDNGSSAAEDCAARLAHQAEKLIAAITPTTTKKTDAPAEQAGVEPQPSQQGDAVSWASGDFYAGHPLPVLHDGPLTNAEILIQALADRLDTARRALADAAAMQVVQPRLSQIKANAAWAMTETDPRRLLPRSAWYDAHPIPVESLGRDADGVESVQPKPEPSKVYQVVSADPEIGGWYDVPEAEYLRVTSAGRAGRTLHAEPAPSDVEALAASIQQILEAKFTLSDEPLPGDCADVLREAARRLQQPQSVDGVDPDIAKIAEYLADAGYPGEGDAMLTLMDIARRRRPQEPAGLIGTVERIGDDEQGQPRIVIHTTREAIKALPENLIGKAVTVGRVQVDEAMVERIARKLAERDGWDGWDSAIDFRDTLNGQIPDEARNEYREIVLFIAAALNPEADNG